MSLLTIWLFAILALLWAAVFVAAPTVGAVVLAERLGVPGRVALLAFGLLVYLPALLAFGLWLAQRWADLVGVPS